MIQQRVSGSWFGVRVLGVCAAVLDARVGDSLGRHESCKIEIHCFHVQGYLAHKKTPTHLGPPQDPRQRSTVGSYGVSVSYPSSDGRAINRPPAKRNGK